LLEYYKNTRMLNWLRALFYYTHILSEEILSICNGYWFLNGIIGPDYVSLTSISSIDITISVAVLLIVTYNVYTLEPSEMPWSSYSDWCDFEIYQSRFWFWVSCWVFLTSDVRDKIRNLNKPLLNSPNLYLSPPK